MEPIVSYVIVTWNNEGIIQQCLDSLTQYTPLECEVIVVDNDSRDNTCSLIRQRNQKNIILIEAGENLGFSRANNLGMKKATGKYIFFVNPDVIFIEDIITPMIKILEENSDIGIVSPRLVYEDLSYQVSSCNYPCAKKVFWDDFQLHKLLPEKLKKVLAQAQYKGNDNRYVDWTYGAAHLCRTNEVLVTGGYPTYYFMYGEDTEFCMLFLNQLKKKTYYLGTSRLIHLGGYSEKQVVSSKKIIYGTKAALFFVNKYYGKFALIRYRLALGSVSLVKWALYTAKTVFLKNQKNINSRIKWKTSFLTVINYDKKPN